MELALGSLACVTGSTELPLHKGHVSPWSGVGIPGAVPTDQQLSLEDFYVLN